MKPGVVYFIQAASGPVKIGYTGDLIDRFTTIQVGNHEDLSLLAAAFAPRSVESQLQYAFERHRIRGEWFRPDAEVLAAAAAFPPEIAHSFMAAWTVGCSECGRGHRNLIELEPGRFCSLCRRCIMARDGRLERFIRMAKEPKPTTPRKACFRCKRMVKITRQGRCGACSEYLRRHGQERPFFLVDPDSKNCAHCGKKERRLRSGRCGACAQYLRRHGRERPLKLSGLA